MSPLARILAPAIVLLGSTACLKPNPLLEEFADEAYGDGDGDTDTDGPPSDLAGTESESGDVCVIPPEFEPDCGACLFESCCTSLAPCSGDPICVCMADCLFAGGSENDCRAQCDAKPTDAESLAQLLSCAMEDCPGCWPVDETGTDTTTDTSTDTSTDTETGTETGTDTSTDTDTDAGATDTTGP